MSQKIDFTEYELHLLKNAVVNLRSDLISKRDTSVTNSDRLFFNRLIKELESLRTKLRGL